MSYEAHLEEQAAYAADIVLSARGHLDPTSEGERAALESLGWARVPVLPALSQAEAPRASFLGVSVTDPVPMAEDESVWICEFEVLVRTLAWDDRGKEADPLKVAAVHRARAQAVQRMLSPLGDRAEFVRLANGEGGADASPAFAVRVHGMDFARSQSGFSGDFREFYTTHALSYSWRG